MEYLGNDGGVEVTQLVAPLMHQPHRLFDEDIRAGALHSNEPSLRSWAIRRDSSRGIHAPLVGKRGSCAVMLHPTTTQGAVHTFLQI